MSIEDIVVYLLLGLVLIGIPIYLVQRLRERQKQRNLGAPGAIPAKTLTLEQHKQIVKNIPQLLFIIGGANVLFPILFSSIPSLAPRAILQIITGLIYVALGFGAQRKWKVALALTIPIFAVERLYNLLSNATVKGWDWASCLSAGFVLFAIMMLWQGYQSMRILEKEEENQQETSSSSQKQDDVSLN